MVAPRKFSGEATLTGAGSFGTISAGPGYILQEAFMLFGVNSGGGGVPYCFGFNDGGSGDIGFNIWPVSFATLPDSWKTFYNEHVSSNYNYAIGKTFSFANTGTALDGESITITYMGGAGNGEYAYGNATGSGTLLSAVASGAISPSTGTLTVS